MVILLHQQGVDDKQKERKMSIKHFDNCKDVSKIKKTFKDLAFKHHPDTGGDEEVMKDINNQYQEALKTQNGKKDDSNYFYKYNEKIEKELMHKIFEIQKLQGLEIALIGCWIWVSGDTKTHKEALKAASFRWNKERLCWYYRPAEWRHTGKSKMPLEVIAARYGYKYFKERESSEKISTSKKLAA